jgi:hypothetical protein
MGKATNVYCKSQIFPAIMCDQIGEDLFQSDAVQWVIGLLQNVLILIPSLRPPVIIALWPVVSVSVSIIIRT